MNDVLKCCSVDGKEEEDLMGELKVTANWWPGQVCQLTCFVCPFHPPPEHCMQAEGYQCYRTVRHAQCVVFSFVLRVWLDLGC